MGIFTPKYPKSDTSGATATTPDRASRRSRRTNTNTSTATTSGMTTDQLRGLATHAAGRLDVGTNTAVIKTGTPGIDSCTQRYVKRSDGTWVAG